MTDQTIQQLLADAIGETALEASEKSDLRPGHDQRDRDRLIHLADAAGRAAAKLDNVHSVLQLLAESPDSEDHLRGAAWAAAELVAQVRQDLART